MFDSLYASRDCVCGGVGDVGGGGWNVIELISFLLYLLYNKLI